jgi:uncharacterized delta-60 repeat protein
VAGAVASARVQRAIRCGVSLRPAISGSLLALATLALWFQPASAPAAPGDLDPTFDGDGKRILRFGGSDVGHAVAIQPDGKIVLAGDSVLEAGESQIAVARLNPDGSDDESFGVGGRSLIPFGDTARARAVALQSDGKIVVVGQTTMSSDNAGADMAIVRLNSNGTPDGSFGAAGKFFVGYEGVERAADVVIEPDGSIVVVGDTTGTGGLDFLVVRINSTGIFDPAAGDFATPVNFGGIDDGREALLQADGSIIAVGATTATDDGSSEDFAATRLLPTGEIDPDFGASGVSNTGFGAREIGAAAALQADGRIVIAGFNEAGGNLNFALTRLAPGGGVDSSFGSAGLATVDLLGVDIAQSTAIQPDGKILAAGYARTNESSPADFGVARLNANGAPDASFGAGGASSFDFGGEDVGLDMALQADGRIVVAGASSGSFAVARLVGGEPTGGGGGGGGGGGDDATCAGRDATIVGTDQAEELVGTRKKDVIAALAGKDNVKAGKGKDVVCAGKGNDRAAGGLGNDILRGEAGRDKLVAGKGRDRVNGGGGNDLCLGGPGDDRGVCERERSV